MNYFFYSQKAKFLLLCLLLSGWNLIPNHGLAATEALPLSSAENCAEALTANTHISQVGAIDTKVKRELILYLYAHPEIFLRSRDNKESQLFEDLSFDDFISRLIGKGINKIILSSADVNYVLTHVGSEGLQNFIAKIASNKNDSVSYYANHVAASFIDLTFFGLPTQEIEKQGIDLDRENWGKTNLYENKHGDRPQEKDLDMVNGTWLGLSIEGYNTSYMGFYKALRDLNLPANTLVVDMGSGIGRLGLMIGAIFPQLRYVGYEYHRFRLQPGLDFVKKHSLKNVDFIQADFSAPEFTPVPGDMFFFYFPNNRYEVMKAATDKLKQLAHNKQFYILSRMTIGPYQLADKLDWLSEVTGFDGSGLFRLHRTKDLSRR